MSPHPSGWPAFLQTATGLALALAIIAGWVSLHLYGVFFHTWSLEDFLVDPLLIAVQAVLGVGLLLVAHDGMHGALAPYRPGLNRRIGRIPAGLFAALPFDRLMGGHDIGRHGRREPALDPRDPRDIADRMVVLGRRYLDRRTAAILAGVVVLYLVVGASLANVVVFWIVPMLLSCALVVLAPALLPQVHGAHFAATHLPWWRLAADPALAEDGRALVGRLAAPRAADGRRS